jgi:hypothetical protein
MTNALKGSGLVFLLGKEYSSSPVLTSIEEVKNIARFCCLLTDAPGIIGHYRVPETHRWSVAG